MTPTADAPTAPQSERATLSRADQSVLWFGMYIAAAGLSLALVPALWHRFGVPVDTPPTPALGIVLAALGAYYIDAARRSDRGFAAATVVIRAVVCVAFISLALLGRGFAAMAIVGLVDGAGAAVTWLLMREPRSGR